MLLIVTRSVGQFPQAMEGHGSGPGIAILAVVSPT
jgi:hypothetical protein